MSKDKKEVQIEKQIRRDAIRKNWKLFSQSKLGMIGLYIVLFFLFTIYFYL